MVKIVKETVIKTFREEDILIETIQQFHYDTEDEKMEIKARFQDRNGGMDMTRAKANEIANEFFKDMNPTFWNGNGDRPDTFDDRIWECELSEYDDLNISLYYDGTDWVHCCEIVDKQSDTMTEMLTGYGIDSGLNLVDTIMDLCRGYE